MPTRTPYKVSFVKSGSYTQMPETFKSSPPNAAYMRQWIGSVLSQVMACRLSDTKPLSKSMLVYGQLNKLQWNFNQNTKLFIHEKASENIICETVAILSRGRWVKGQCSYLESKCSIIPRSGAGAIVSASGTTTNGRQYLTYWGWHKMASFLHTTFPNAFSLRWIIAFFF